MDRLSGTWPQHGMSRDECDELVRDLAWSGYLALTAGVYYPTQQAERSRPGANLLRPRELCTNAKYWLSDRAA